MKTLTIEDAGRNLHRLFDEACGGEVIILTEGIKEVALAPRPVLDPEVDSPELEAELLKAIDGPYTNYSSGDMQALADRIIRERQRT